MTFYERINNLVALRDIPAPDRAAALSRPEPLSPVLPGLGAPRSTSRRSSLFRGCTNDPDKKKLGETIKGLRAIFSPRRCSQFLLMAVTTCRY